MRGGCSRLPIPSPQPGSKLDLIGVPNRTSYELRPLAELGAFYSLVEVQRMLR